MATTPSPKVFTNISSDALNAIRNQASQNYRNYVPVATSSADSIKAVGAVIMDSPDLRNEFIHTLINRIALVIVTSELYSNPWSVFKRGILDFGETIENVFIELTKVYEFNPVDAQSSVFQREIPDVRTAFHVMNYQKFYKVTVSMQMLRQAFMSANGVTDLIAKITEKIYTSANYDEFLVMKYMLAKKIVEGQLYGVATNNPSTSADAAKAFIASAKQVSNMWEFMSPDYNLAGVRTTCDKSDQYVIIPAEYDALIDVNVLASAFNMDKAEFMGHKILIDSFAPTDTARLAEIFANDPAYVALTSDEITALGNVYGVIVDKDWFMIYDNLNEFTEIYNPEGLYWNYDYHQWKTFSINPFANAAVFGTLGTISSVEVSPATSTLTKTGSGETVQCTATVTASGIVNQDVVWSSSDTAKATVDQRGLVTIKTLAAGASVTITATSVADSTATDTCVISRANS